MTTPKLTPCALVRASALCISAAAFFVSAPHVLADVPVDAVVAVDGDGPIALRAMAVDTSVRQGQLAEVAGAASVGKRHLIQLNGPMTPARRDAITKAGIVLDEAIEGNSFVARLGGADPAQVAGLEFIRWHGEFEAAWKLDPELGARTYQTLERRELADKGQSFVIVTFFAGFAAEEYDAVAQWIAGRPGSAVTLRDSLGANPILSAQINLADTAELAQFSAVQFIEEAPEITLRNDTNRWIVQTNVAGFTPIYDNGIMGQGQLVGILDSRVSSSHCSFTDSNPIGASHRKIQAYNASLGSSSHGTHVAGTVVGDAGNTSATRGVAYMGRFVYAPIPSFSETGTNNALQLHHNQGARVHTNSWGDDGTTAYNALARAFDVFSHNNEESLALLAVTNQSVLRNPENAKNLLAVGASRDTPSQHLHCTGGVGPTSDGRRKPEIYAPGCSTISASGTGCSTSSSTGTSMATPAVAGAAMLARQYYVDGFYPSGIANSADSLIPSGALLKATLLNSSVDMTGIAGYPSNLEGWGRVTLANSMPFADGPRPLLIEDVRNADGLSTGGENEIEFEVLSPLQQLRVTMVFTDVPGASFVANAWVNNLDLVVEGPSGQMYLGNVFSGGESTTGGTADIRNNVEQVHLSSPEAGVWKARIIGTNVAVGTQGYALVITGDVAAPSAGPSCPGDFDGDGFVGSTDLSLMLGAWAGSDPLYDLDGDGTIGSTDLSDLLGSWGPCP